MLIERVLVNPLNIPLISDEEDLREYSGVDTVAMSEILKKLQVGLEDKELKLLFHISL